MESLHLENMHLSLRQGVHVLTLTNGDNDNMFTQEVVNEYLTVFDIVERYKGNTSLLITCQHKKTFSTGIDLAWLYSVSAAESHLFMRTLERVIFRFTMFNAPTIACLNGNAYAGAAILSCGADFRVMRNDRGRFCLPEVNLKLPFRPMMLDVIRLLPNPHAIKQMVLTGNAYTGVECFDNKIVDAIYPPEKLQDQAFELALGMAAKDRTTYTKIKHSLRQNIARRGIELECY